MTNRPVIRLGEPIGAEYEEFRIRLAGDIKKIPSNAHVISALMTVATEHYDETLAEIQKQMGRV